MSIYWLKCEVTGSMLPHELAIAVVTASGEKVSLFVADDKIRASESGSSIRVDLIDQNSTHGLVRLPAKSMERSSVVKVDNNLLSPGQ